MARSKNCLKCEYCRQLHPDCNVSDWKNKFSCDYLLIEHQIGDKGDNPDNCKLFKPKIGGGYCDKRRTQ